MSRVRALLLALGLGLAGVVAAPTTAAYAAACSGTSGVTVVVSSPAGTSVRCAAGDPSSGLGALSAAGFSVTQVQTQPGFVCRINGYPSTDPCVRTPPASASWSYWHAKRGGSWTYSTSGAASYDPVPGTVEGWSFGSGGPPAIAPPAATSTPAPAPKPSSSTSTPKPSPRTTVRTTPRPSTPRPSTPAAGSASSSSSPTTATATTAPQPTTTSTTATGTTGTGGATTGEGTALAAGPASPATPGAGSPWPLLGGLALVLAVGGGAAYTVRRSRAH